MSKVGKKPVGIPQDVKVQFDTNSIVVDGPNGNLTHKILSYVKVKFSSDNKSLIIERTSDHKQAKMNHGSLRSIINNMISGVVKGFERSMRISGTGYAAKLQGDKLVLTVGFSNPKEIAIPKDLKITIPDPTLIVIKGADKQKVNQFAAYIRSIRPVEPYNLKGIKYEDEVVKKKAGKTFVSGA